MNISEEPQAYHDDIQQDGTPLFPYVGIKIGQEDDYFLLNIYRPTLQKELCVDGRVVKYTENEVYIPYILKEELTLNDFSTEGFRSYSCNNLSSIYPHLEDVSNAHLMRGVTTDISKQQLLMIQLLHVYMLDLDRANLMGMSR
jgi:hypothetical protein